MFFAPLDQVGRPDHAAGDAHRPEQLGDLLAIGRGLHLQIGQPRALAPLGLEDFGVDLLPDKGPDRRPDRPADHLADDRQHQGCHLMLLEIGKTAFGRLQTKRSSPSGGGGPPEGWWRGTGGLRDAGQTSPSFPATSPWRIPSSPRQTACAPPPASLVPLPVPGRIGYVRSPPRNRQRSAPATPSSGVSTTRRSPACACTRLAGPISPR